MQFLLFVVAVYLIFQGFTFDDIELMQTPTVNEIATIAFGNLKLQGYVLIGLFLVNFTLLCKVSSQKSPTLETILLMTTNLFIVVCCVQLRYSSGDE